MLIIIYVFNDFIASQVIVPSHFFIHQLIHMYFDQKPVLTTFCHYATSCAQLPMLCKYVIVFLEIGQMSSESTFTLSSDTFE